MNLAEKAKEYISSYKWGNKKPSEWRLKMMDFKWRLKMEKKGKCIWVSRNDKGHGLTYVRKLHGELKT